MLASIPETVIAKILDHRPHLLPMVNTLRRTSSTTVARKVESDLASNFLAGTCGALTGPEALSLAKCKNGQPYGG